MVWEGVMIAFHVWELFLFPCEGAKSILEAIPDEANTKELNQLLSPHCPYLICSKVFTLLIGILSPAKKLYLMSL